MTRITVAENDPSVLVAAMKKWLPEKSWTQVRRLIRGRRVSIYHSLVMDEQRRLAVGDTVEIHDAPLPPPPTAEDITIYHCDRDLVVVHKPARMLTLRHKAERHWPAARKMVQPTLEEVIPQRIVRSRRKQAQTELYSVHRIDRDTSGLLVFARHAQVQQDLIDQFAEHDVVRVYQAFVWGEPAPRTLRSFLVRDRGDGLRGSFRDEHGEIVRRDVSVPRAARSAVTEVSRALSQFDYRGDSISQIECRLETGRTHQIRIHLSEIGHPVCGDPVYRCGFGEEPISDTSGAPRLALHASQLGFTHPHSGEVMHFEAELPHDLAQFAARLSGDPKKGGARAPRSSRRRGTPRGTA